MLRITDFDIVIYLNITCCDSTRTLFTQCQLGFLFTIHHQSHAFEVKKDFYDILLHTLDRTVFMQHTLNLYLGNRTTGHRRK